MPGMPVLASILRRASLIFAKGSYIAVPGTVSRSRGLIPPSECVPYWKRIFKWGNEDDYLIEDDYFDETDLTSEEKERILSDLSKRLRLMHKSRLLFKQPGLTLRIKYLNALFSEARFLHVIRNPLNHLYSLRKAKQDSGQKFWGIKIPGWRNYLEVDLAIQSAMHIKSVMDILEDDLTAKAEIRERYLQIKYEDIVTKPMRTMTGVLSFCELDLTPEIEVSLEGIQNRDHLVEQTNIPEDAVKILEPLYEKYNYALEGTTAGGK